ncbi:MAG TPA: hypothetical protein VK785_09955 [Opitutaceae bacterium]|nr:hypothetical protein [Opitutaceae bacterium]
MAHWIKAAPKEIYLVQTPDEAAKALDLAFPSKTEPISGKGYMKVAIAACPIPPGLEAEGSDASGS